MKKFIGLITGFFVAMTTFNVAAEPTLIAPPTSSLLGTASSFSVFMENDFGANGSDCEGRIACGGGANLGRMEFYSTNRGDYASVVVGRGPLQQLDSGNRIFVVGTQVKDEDIKVNGTVYHEDLIDFNSEFNYLRQVSKSLAAKGNGTVSIANQWCKYITFAGDNEYNYFTVDASIFNTDQCFVDFQVPKNSYSIVNILGTNVNLNTHLYGMSYAGQRINGNNDELNSHVLYNLPSAGSFTFSGAGTFYGSVLAPYADGSDDMEFGAHLAGELIAKSYFGGIEFGGITYSGGRDTTITTTINNIASTTTTASTNSMASTTTTETIITNITVASTTSTTITSTAKTTLKTFLSTTETTALTSETATAAETTAITDLTTAETTKQSFTTKKTDIGSPATITKAETATIKVATASNKMVEKSPQTKDINIIPVINSLVAAAIIMGFTLFKKK